MKSLLNSLKVALAHHPKVKLAIIFGSLSTGKANADSDLDLAVAAIEPLTLNEKQDLIGELAQLSGRPVDLIDLKSAPLTISHQVLTKGKLFYCLDRRLYAELIKKMLFDQADMMPYRERILAERRDAWIKS